MNKKVIAYILIGVAVLIGLYFLYTKMSSSAATTALGAGAPDTRGAWAAEDDALYTKFRGMFSTADLNWLDPLVTQAYNNSSYGEGVPCNDDVKIQGKASKAGAMACVVYGVIVNPKGTFPGVSYAAIDPGTGQKIRSLWNPTIVDTMWNDLAALRVKYGGL